MIDDFRLGFAPDSRDGLIAALKRENVPIEKIVEAGLAIQPEDRREPYDRFRGRVMFVINDRRGRAIAFGGRVMGAGEPKYLNSPETPLFHKGANLYCLDRARQAVTKDQPVIVAEGYMDVIALHGAGFTGAVAPLGTALTEGQLAELWKLADEPYLCFDGDNAGRRAAARGAERALPLLRAGKSLRFLVLPAGEDPDSLIRMRGPDAIRRVLDLARPLSDVVWDMETEGKSVDTPERRASLQRAVERRVAEISDPVVRDYYRTEMRSRLNRLRRPEGPAWQPGNRHPFRRPGTPEPAPFAAGAAARRAGADLDCFISWPRISRRCRCQIPSSPACAAPSWTPCRCCPWGSTQRPTRRPVAPLLKPGWSRSICSGSGWGGWRHRPRPKPARPSATTRRTLTAG
jgi:DNA primase